MAAWLVFGLVMTPMRGTIHTGSYRLRSIHTPAFQLDESGRSSQNCRGGVIGYVFSGLRLVFQDVFGARCSNWSDLRRHNAIR